MTFIELPCCITLPCGDQPIAEDVELDVTVEADQPENWKIVEIKSPKSTWAEGKAGFGFLSTLVEQQCETDITKACWERYTDDVRAA